MSMFALGSFWIFKKRNIHKWNGNKEQKANHKKPHIKIIERFVFHILVLIPTAATKKSIPMPIFKNNTRIDSTRSSLYAEGVLTTSANVPADMFVQKSESELKNILVNFFCLRMVQRYHAP